MDNSKDAPTLLSFCTGYGGLDIGLELGIGKLRTIANVEIEAFAIKNLVDKMEAGKLDPAPVYTNLKTFPMEQFRDRVDCFTAGFPCQPFSCAGNRNGTEDPRHLWPYIEKAVVSIRPTLCFFENVEGIISATTPDGRSVLHYVLCRLEEMGYRATAGIFSASEIGSTHQRKRVFIMAYRKGASLKFTRGNWQSTEYVDGQNISRAVARPGENQWEWEEPRVI